VEISYRRDVLKFIVEISMGFVLVKLQFLLNFIPETWFTQWNWTGVSYVVIISIWSSIGVGNSYTSFDKALY